MSELRPSSGSEQAATPARATPRTLGVPRPCWKCGRPVDVSFTLLVPAGVAIEVVRPQDDSGWGYQASHDFCPDVDETDAAGSAAM